MGTIESPSGDLVADVIGWLDDEALSLEWHAEEYSARQLSLY
ncbi:hypothetical protein [Novosphingobium kaempferiae]|nr:hypothetical protein [Novosphingobium kaempferiae]